MIMFYAFFLIYLTFDNLLYAFFLFYENVCNTIKWQCSYYVSLTATVVQILAVSVLLPSSESVSTHCIHANIYNAQHGKLEAKFFAWAFIYVWIAHV